MKRIFLISKYIQRDIFKAMLIFYGVILTVSTVVIGSFISLSQQGGTKVSFGGFGLTAVLFLFIAALNSFKENFEFMQANNITRKSFFAAAIVSLARASAVMALLDVFMSRLLRQIMPYQGMFEQLYKNDSLIADLLWTFGGLLLAACTGWMITTLYYRCGPRMKTAVSILPVLMILLLVIVNDNTGGLVSRGLMSFVTVAFGNAYIAVLTFLICSLGVGFVSYLLIRRMPVRD
jgi:hypothetical protein